MQCGRVKSDVGETSKSTDSENNGEMNVISYEEVVARVKEKGEKLVILCGDVYDVHTIEDSHPGGKQIFEDNFGRDVTSLFFGNIDSGGTTFSNLRKAHSVNHKTHFHSYSAFQKLSMLKVASLKKGSRENDNDAQRNSFTTWKGSSLSPCNNGCIDGSYKVYMKWKDRARDAYVNEILVENKTSAASSRCLPNVDLYVDISKPIVGQIGRLEVHQYEEWIHTNPCVSADSPRFFESDFLEFCSKSQWFMVPFIWIPISFLSIASGILQFQSDTLTSFDRSNYDKYVSTNSMISVLQFGGLGYIMWYFLEYTIHRFVFHLPPSTKWGMTLHFIVHGCHHKFPMDRMRLVFPPTAAAPLALTLYYLLHTILSGVRAALFFGGLVLGYVMYDLTHYALHYPLSSNSANECGVAYILQLPFLVRLRKAHFYHHFVSDEYNFGITSPLLDKLLFTSQQR